MQNEIKDDLPLTLNEAQENSNKVETNNTQESTNNVQETTEKKDNKEIKEEPKIKNEASTEKKIENQKDKNKADNNTDDNKTTEEQIYEGYDSDNSALSDSDISENQIESLPSRTSMNKKMELDAFYKQKRQYFIMNMGGTPIYSRYGDEIKNCSIFATFSAIITKFTVFNGGDNESLNYIKNEYSLIVFLKKRKLFLIAVSNKNDSVSFLYNQLELLYHFLLSIITNERMFALEEKPSSCAKFILDSNPLFEQLIEYSAHTLNSILKSFPVLPIDNRNKLNEICSKYRGESLLTGIITPGVKEIIALNKSSVIDISSSDMILIQCIISVKTVSGEKELWLPICMPGISADGLLQLYCNFELLNPYGILFITEKQENTIQSTFAEAAKKICEEIKEKGLVSIIDKTIETKNNADYIKEEIQNNPLELDTELLKDFIKKLFSSKNKGSSKGKLSSSFANELLQKNTSFGDAYKTFTTSMINPTSTNNLGNIPPQSTKLISLGKIGAKLSSKNDPFLKLNFGIIHHRLLAQIFSVNFHSYEYLTKEEKYIQKTYMKLYDYYCTYSKNMNIGDTFYHVEKDKRFSNGIYVTETYIIFGSFNAFKLSNEINDVFKEIVKIIKQYESNFFITTK